METEVEDNSDNSILEPSIATSYTENDTVFQSTSLATTDATNANQPQIAEETPKVLRYTTSIATISTPKNAIRVATRRKPQFGADTFKLFLCSPTRDTIVSSLLPTTETLEFPQPFAASTPQCSIRRRADCSEHSTESIICYESRSEYQHDDDYRKCIERLERKVIFEEKHIAESAKNVSFWKRKDNHKYSMNELCAHALLLISKTRLRTYQELVTRVQTLHRMTIVPASIAKSIRTTFTIYNMQINLTRTFYLNRHDSGENYVFLILFSTGEKVVATEIIQVNDNENVRRLRVDEPIHLVGLPLAFQIKMEIFALKIVTRVSKSPREFAKKAFNFIGQCRSPHTVQQYDNSDDDEIETNAFKPVGHAYLTRESDGHTSFLISDNEYPLDGSMDIKCEVSKLPPDLTEIMAGYWTLISDSSFNKLWVKMFNGVLHFYNDHEQSDDQYIEPVYLIDMSTICTRKIEPEMAIFKNAEHKYTFYMDVLSFPRGSDLCVHKRYLVAIETEELLQKWLNKINKCLELIRDRIS
jgi:hypothetical protein